MRFILFVICYLIIVIRKNAVGNRTDADDTSSKDCKAKIVSFLESTYDLTADLHEVVEAGLVDTLLGYTDMGASRVFQIIDSLEKRYKQEDSTSVFDDLDSL